MPNLPGYTIKESRSPTKRNIFKYVEKQMFVDDKSSSEMVRDMVDCESSTSIDMGSSLSRTWSSNTFLQNANEVLKFEGWYENHEIEMLDDVSASMGKRYCTILYFMEDETIQIVERRDVDQPQTVGSRCTLLRRMKIPRDKYSEEYMGLDDLDVGDVLDVYGRTYHIYDANSATRHYLLKHFGRELNPTIEADLPPLLGGNKDEVTFFGRKKNDLSSFAAASMGQGMTKKQAGFIQYKNKCLRFTGVWDDTESLYGDLTIFKVHYFLADDTVEVIVERKPNSGHGGLGTLLLKRDPLPRDPEDHTKGDVHWTDFSIGAVVQIYCRPLLIVDADSFTRDFFAKEGTHLDEALPIETQAEHELVFEREIPPYIGFGSEEDSLASCVGSLIPRAPKKHFGENRVLTYLACMESELEEDRGREFVINYFLFDNTAQIHEPPIRNSGVIGGTFLNRMVVKDANEVPVTVDQLYVGARVNLGGHFFNITDANDATIRWIGDRSDLFPQAEFRHVMTGYKMVFGDAACDGSLERQLEELDETKDGYITCEAMLSLMGQYGLSGPKHMQGLLTVLRNVGRRRKRELRWAKFISLLLE